MAVFAGYGLAAQLKFNLNNKCSNKQAEQLAIVKALEATETLDITENGPRTAAILTDSTITTESLQNISHHIRKKASVPQTADWATEFSWVKARVVADQLAKAAARNGDATIFFNKIPQGTPISETEEESIQKWQKEWNECRKAVITQQFLPNVQDGSKRTQTSPQTSRQW